MAQEAFQSKPQRLSSPTAHLNAPQDQRIYALQQVYREFDLDHGGDVGADELLALGKARRVLGQKPGEWTQEQNKRVLQRMNADKDGNVTLDNFVR